MNLEGVKFCDTCGANMAGGVCPDCGHKNQADAKFCDTCGANIKGAVKQSGLPKETGKKPGLSPVLKIAIGIIGLITFVGGALRMLQYSNFSLPKFLSGSESSLEEESNITMVAYTTNPATVIEEGTPITMVFIWLADTKEQVRDFIDNSEQEVVVNGTTIIAKITFGEISSDEATGGFKTQVTVEIGNLPAGTNTIITTISWKQKITDGKESFGPGTDNEKVKKEAKIIVGSQLNVQQAVGDSAKAAQSGDTSNCPTETEITIGEATWFEDMDDPHVLDGVVAVEIRNKLGWEKSEEMPPEPVYFAEEAFVGEQGGCDVDPIDDMLMVCLTKIDHKPSKMQLHLPYPWSASPIGYCVLEDLNMNVVEPPVECPTTEDLRTGEIFWDKGYATLYVTNTLGWEPYEEDPTCPSSLSVHGEHWIYLGCEVEPHDDTIMKCRGRGDQKYGGLSMKLCFPWPGEGCEYTDPDVKILDVCGTGSFLCPMTGACCPDGNICDAQGCYSNAPPAPSSDDDHYH